MIFQLRSYLFTNYNNKKTEKQNINLNIIKNIKNLLIPPVSKTRVFNIKIKKIKINKIQILKIINKQKGLKCF